jgi:ketosteroid isomerase-like protein
VLYFEVGTGFFIEVEMKKAFLGTFVVLAMAAASFGQSKDEAAIRNVMDDQAAAWNRGDIDGFMAGYWRSEKLTFVSGTSVTRGWQETLDRYKKGYDTRAKMGTLTFSDLEITILSKDAAVVLGSWSLAREKDNPHGKFTLIFRKFKDGWRVVMDHTS